MYAQRLPQFVVLLILSLPVWVRSTDEKAIPQPELIDPSTQTVLLGTWQWDIEADRQDDPEVPDVWWEQVNDVKQILAPVGGARLTIVKHRSFGALNRKDLAAMEYSTDEITNAELTPGAVIAMRTSEGNYAKLKVVGYRALHDFSFPEAKLLPENWRAHVLRHPDRPNYHLSVKWVLYRK